MDCEVRADRIQKVLSWVRIGGNGTADVLEVARDIRNGSVVACLASRKKEKIVKELEGCCRWLVDTCDYDKLYSDVSVVRYFVVTRKALSRETYIVCYRQFFDIRDDFVTSS